jgi:hypothetical protein
MKEFFKDSWKIIKNIVGVIAIAGALIGFYAYFATSEELKAVKAEAAVNLEKAKLEMKATIEGIQKRSDFRLDQDRLERVDDNLTKARLQERTYPKKTDPQGYKDVKEDIEKLKADKEKIQQRIDKR